MRMYVINSSKSYSNRLLNDAVIALLAQPPTDHAENFLFICSKHWPSTALNGHEPGSP
jgi:hypothetical protein